MVVALHIFKTHAVKWLALLLVVYFLYHIFSGNNGLITARNLEKKQQHVGSELALLSKERQKLEHKVTHFYDTNLDKDLLDEQARRVLGYIGSEQLIYYFE